VVANGQNKHQTTGSRCMSVTVVKGVAEEYYDTHVRLNDTPHQEDR